MVDGKLHCLSCFERFMDMQGMDGHRVYRISDNEADFADETHCPTACGARA